MYVHRALSCHCRQQCEFQHSSPHADCNFDARHVSKNSEVLFNKETEKARLPTDSCLNNSKRPSLVNCISTNPECRSDHQRLVCNHSLVLIPRVSALSVISLKVLAKFGVSQCSQKFRAASCHCFASCHCCHDLFIVRSAQTRPPFTGFTQLCTSVSMFTINADNCMFLCSCLRVCSPVTRSIIGSSPSSCSGVRDPWSVEYQCCCGAEAETRLRYNISAVLRCKHLLGTEVSVLNSFSYPKSTACQCVSFVVLLPAESSKKQSNCHFVCQPSLEFPDPVK